MTDEERAREIAARYGDTWPPERKMALTLAIVDALTSTRAEQREKCARELEATALQKKEVAERISEKIQGYAAAGAGKKCAKLRVYRAAMHRRRFAFEEAAAAIRSMGDN